jgi:hypothetical protein
MAAMMFACSAIAHAATPNISSHKGKTGTLQITTVSLIRHTPLRVCFFSL